MMRLLVVVLCLLLTSCTPASDGERDDSISPDIPDDQVTYCPAVSTEMKAGDCRLLERQIDSLKSGTGNFEPPSEMMRGETATVRFFVAPHEDGLSQSEASDGGTANPAKSVKLPLKIGRVMSAELDGAGFVITPEGEQIRDLGAANKASWSWTLTAKQGGELPLYLNVKVKALDKDGTPTELDLYKTEKVISVDVTATQWLEDRATAFTGLFSTLAGAIKALTALVVALAALYFAIRNFRKPKPPESSR